MGVVYLATDPRLGRQVAIKLLPGREGARPERLARLEREARALATVNHPAVATLFSIEEHAPPEGGKVRGVLVLEYVPGVTLGERLRAGPLAVEDGLRIMAQVAAGLEAAHAAGVIHRDLKPDNITITADGQAKILDFGIAKSEGDAPESDSGEDAGGFPAGNAGSASNTGTGADPSRPPTRTGTRPGSMTLASAADLALTRAGTVLGTPGYMSPEQARGGVGAGGQAKPIDKRTDIWSLGCVLFEVLTGVRAFPGKTAGEAMRAVLEAEPAYSLLPPSTPARVRHLLDRCLQKDPARRLRDVGDARLELERALELREWSPTGTRAMAVGDPTSQTPFATQHTPPLSPLRALILGAVLGVMLGVALSIALRGAPDILRPSSQPWRLALPWPAGVRGPGTPVPTPSGRAVYFIDERGLAGWMRLDGPDSGAVEGLGPVRTLAVDPAGQWLAAATFAADHPVLVRIPLRDDRPAGPPVEIARDLGATALAWSGSRTLVALLEDGRTLRVFDLGEGAAAPREVVLPEALGSARLAPVLACTESHVLVTLTPPGKTQPSVWALPIGGAGTNPPPAPTQPLIEQAQEARVLEAGIVLFVRGTALMAAPFDPAAPAMLGEPLALPVGEVERGFAATPGGLLILPSADPARAVVYIHIAEVVEAVRAQ